MARTIATDKNRTSFRRFIEYPFRKLTRFNISVGGLRSNEKSRNLKITLPVGDFPLRVAPSNIDEVKKRRRDRGKVFRVISQNVLVPCLLRDSIECILHGSGRET